MSDEQQPAASADEKTPEQIFEIQRIYLKDASFESPSVPQIFTQEFKPETNVDLNSVHRKLQDNIYEVELKITLTAKVKDDIAYLVEIKQAGIFGAAGYDDEQMGHMLSSYCPNLLFPFAREVISDLIVKGGFPQMLLAPINFDALYMQTLQEQKKSAEDDTATKH